MHWSGHRRRCATQRTAHADDVAGGSSRDLAPRRPPVPALPPAASTRPVGLDGRQRAVDGDGVPRRLHGGGRASRSRQRHRAGEHDTVLRRDPRVVRRRRADLVAGLRRASSSASWESSSSSRASSVATRTIWPSAWRSRLAAAIGWAAGTFVVKELVVRHPEVDLIGVTAGQYLVGGAALLVLSTSFEGFGGTEWSSGELWVSVAFVSIVGCALATIAYFAALRRLSATTATAWSFLSPVRRRAPRDRAREHAACRRAGRDGGHDRGRRDRRTSAPQRPAVLSRSERRRRRGSIPRPA